MVTVPHKMVELIRECWIIEVSDYKGFTEQCVYPWSYCIVRLFVYSLKKNQDGGTMCW